MANKGERLGPRPDTWVYPGDRAASDKHRAWSRAKAQANFRKEEWLLEEQYWMNDLWPEHLWKRRGRSSDGLGITRWDREKAWTPENTFIVTRRGHVAWAHSPDHATLEEIEPGVWDISGESLLKYHYGLKWRKKK
jgi:hypothetical protein